MEKIKIKSKKISRLGVRIGVDIVTVNVRGYFLIKVPNMTREPRRRIVKYVVYLVILRNSQFLS